MHLALDSILVDNTNDQYVYADIHSNLGLLFFQMERYEEAIEWYKKAIHINKENNDLSGLSWDYNGLGSVYLTLNRKRLAFKYLKKADSLSRFASTLELVKDIKQSLFKYYLVKSEIDSALKYANLYTKLNDSIVSQETAENIQFMEARAKFQLEKNESALALSQEREALAKAESNTNKLYLIIALIGLVVLVSAYAFTYYTSKQKRKIALLELKFQQQEIKELQANQEAEALSSMLKGQEEERERIAKDLHDQLGGTLAALKMTLRKEGNIVDQEDLETVDQAVIEVRNIAHNLSNGLLEKQGFGVALKELKANIERSGKLKFNLFLQSGLAEIKQEAAIELYRIVQELTNNTIKHAQANEISLQTNVNEESFNLIFEDDGIGFDKKKQTGGMGMRNIEARVKKIKGNFHLDSKKGRGTIAIIEIERKS